ncbi:MAG: hypothetical protein ABIL49_01295 [candidate division WOR-3 bacterium]|jgi:hypothetical protein
MSRFIIFLFLFACSKIIDIEVSNYLPFKKFSTWIYLDQNNQEFQIKAIKDDSLFIILDFEGNLEKLLYTGDMILIRRTIEYSKNDQLIIAYDGYLPYFPYPFVNGFNREFIISGNDYFSRTLISVEKSENLRYAINYYYFEKTPNSQKIIRRYYIFAPDSFIVYAKLGPDTIMVGDYKDIKDEKILRIKEILPWTEF